MAHLAHYKVAGVAPMLAHYERKAELERGYERENIDPERTAGNYAIGAKSPQELAQAVRERVAEAREATVRDSGRAMRKDANTLSDWVVTLPRDCPRGRARGFFECAVRFVQARYGAENVPGGFVHMDEATPHVHIPVVPVKDGRIRAAKVFTQADLRGFHKGLQAAEDEALGIHVSVELAESDKGTRQLSHLSQDEYRAARDELRRAQGEAREAAEDAARSRQKASQARAEVVEARKAIESAKAAQRASEASRDAAIAEAADARTDAETWAEVARALGPDGDGMDMEDGTHLMSAGEARAAARDEAATLEGLRERSGRLAAEISERSERISALDAEISDKEGRSARLDSEWQEAQQAHKARMEGLRREEERAAGEVAELERQVADAEREAVDPELGVPAGLAGRVERCAEANQRLSDECVAAVGPQGKVRGKGLPARARSRGRLEVIQEQQALDRAAGPVEGPAREDVERLARAVQEQQRRAGELGDQLGAARRRNRSLGASREALARVVRVLRERLGRLRRLAVERGVRPSVRLRERPAARRARLHRATVEVRREDRRSRAWRR